jgi:hypothetical protein
VAALAERTLVTLPSGVPAPDAADDWQTTAWQHDPREAMRAVDGTVAIVEQERTEYPDCR